MHYEALARENAELRGLAHALPPVADRGCRPKSSTSS